MEKEYSPPESVTTPHRLETFSDGVMAIIITVMVLRLSAPSVPTLSGWQPFLPQIVAYVLSFIFIAQYWNSHHQLLRFTKRISGGVMWANMHLLFWLSLIPVATAWIGEDDNYLHESPTVLYGAIALMASIAYAILTRLIKRIEPEEVAAHHTVRNTKNITSIITYTGGVVIAALGLPLVGIVCYVLVSVLWLIPDRRLARLWQRSPVRTSIRGN
ncbi:MAG TPA: TMEM175 family protein [Candidatus Saccharimonadales bacterium]|nr:TMEM175 family protein [Candidatus Saccharimonadales bacterium]